MDIKEKYFLAIEEIKIISKHLSELSNMVETIYMGLEREKMERQVLDCIACIGSLIKMIHGLTESVLYQMKEEADKES